MSGGLCAKRDAHGQDETRGRGGNSAPSPKEDMWSAAVMEINADSTDPFWVFLLNTIIEVTGMSWTSSS